MMRSFRIAAAGFLFFLVVLLASRNPAAFAAEFTVRDVGTLGGQFSSASGLNESGEVVGDSTIGGSGLFRPFVFTGGTMKNLGTLGGAQSMTFGFGINALGAAVGEFDTGPSTGTHGFLHNGTTMIDLGNLGATGGLSFTRAQGINTAGKVVGSSPTANHRNHAFVWSNGVMTDLGTLGGSESSATAINEAGQIVGDSAVAGDATRHAFLHTPGAMIDLGTLGGAGSVAFAINSAGQVVGGADTAAGERHAFLWSGSAMTDLGTLGGKRSSAAAINSAGVIVGDSTLAGDEATTHGFIYRNNTMIDLNTLVPPGITILHADGINSAGQIAATGSMAGSSDVHALLLTPIVLNRVAYAWANQPTAATYTPSAQYAYNGGGGTIRVTRQSTGAYDVTFSSLPGWGNNGLSSAVAVTPYGSSAISCSVASYASSVTTAVATVACYNVVTRVPADSRFMVLVVGNQSVPAPSAFVFTGGSAPVPPPNPAWNWTSGSLPVSVTHAAGAGTYNVLLGSGNNPKTAKLVTGAGGATRCNNGQSISGGLQVRCYDTSGAPADQRFWVIQVGGGLPGRRVGLALANQPTVAAYTPSTVSSFNSSGGAISANRSAPGRYTMTFTGLQKLAGHTETVQVTPVGTALRTCNVVSWGNSGSSLRVSVECRNAAGQLADTRYQVLVIE
jgi:probable HAF family extracellular repeat protein